MIIDIAKITDAQKQEIKAAYEQGDGASLYAILLKYDLLLGYCPTCNNNAISLTTIRNAIINEQIKF